MIEEFSYILIKEKRRSISLSVDKLGQIRVKAPVFTPKLVIDHFVISKKTWISSAQEKINKLNKTPRAESGNDLIKQKVLVRKLIEERINFFNASHIFHVGKITIKNITSRWGSCSAKGNLNFNYRLIYLPLELLDYVVVHELCHLLEHNHSARFWMEVKKILPDYKKLENKIKKYSLC